MAEWERRAGEPAHLMGVLNCTPDSFSDGGRFVHRRQAVEHGLTMWRDGASIIDVGGESTRPGAKPVALDEELQRVLPVVRALVDAGCRVSVDTMKAEVMRQAVALGACMINDVSALRADSESLAVAADCEADICLMHMQGTPENMQRDPRYPGGVLSCVRAFFERRLEACEKAGIARHRLVLDPGIGFGKRLQDNLALIAHLDELRRYFSLPLLLGVSRKSFIGEVCDAKVEAREWGTAGAVAVGAFLGADILRVHDVRHHRDVVAIASALAEHRR